MGKHANILAKVEFKEHVQNFFNNIKESQYIFMWDYDRKDLRIGDLTRISEKHGIQIHIIETVQGFHFLSFACFNESEIFEIEKDFYKKYPSDYPTIIQLKAEEEEIRDQSFEGHTLRITHKDSNDLKYYGFVEPVSEDKLNKSKSLLISYGHVYIYKLVTENDFKFSGNPMRTKVALCGFPNY